MLSALSASYNFKPEQPLALEVKVPATSANMGPGFDVMGIALQIYNVYRCTLLAPDQKNQIQVHYKELAQKTALCKLSPNTDAATANEIPLNENNLFWKGYLLLFKKLQAEPPRVRIEMEVEIPLTRGLGSSSTVILASMVIANALCERLYNKSLATDKLLDLAISIEGHPDNLAPAMLGGWVIAIHQKTNDNFGDNFGNNSNTNLKEENLADNSSTSNYLTKQMTLKAPVYFAGLIPHQTLSTQKAREILPQQYKRADVIRQAGNAALYSYLLAQKTWSGTDAQIFSSAIGDILHQPYRQKLINGMQETFAHWKSLGCLGAYLSGAGTTLMGIWPNNITIEEQSLAAAMRQKQTECTPILPSIDLQGLQWQWI